MRQKGQATWAAATFVLALAGAGIGTVAGAYATFVTRSEYNRDIETIKRMLERLYEDRFHASPAIPNGASGEGGVAPHHEVHQNISGCDQKVDIFLTHSEFFPCV